MAVEKKEDYGPPPEGTVGQWLAEIRAYDRTFDEWTKSSKAAVKRYRNELETSTGRSTQQRFSILWSSVQTLQPALYSRMPQADITRTHRDRDPISRATAVILEAAVREQLQQGGFDETMRAARDDYLLTSRGQSWVRYVPTYGDEQRDRVFLQAPIEEGGGYIKDDGSVLEPGVEVKFGKDGEPYAEEGEPYAPVIDECVKQEHVPWADFGHTPAPSWNKVRAVWKREQLTRQQIEDRFGKKIAKEFSLTYNVANVSDADKEAYGDAFKRGVVYEIWDRTSKRVIWISPGYTQGPLDSIADPLHLEGFFPCPRPLYGTITTDSLIPVTDYDQIKSQALEIDRLTQRIGILTKALKLAGAYNGQHRELEKILTAPDNIMIPVEDWGGFAEKGGIKGSIDFVPIKEVAETIQTLIAIRDQAKRDLFEVSGLSDIVRGQAQGAQATATEQRIKGQYAGMRIEDRQNMVARFARDTVRITAELVAEHFSPETLWAISGWEFSDEARALARNPQGPQPRDVFDQAVKVLRSDKLRGYNIDIETDSMVLEDQQQEKANRIEFLGAATGFLKEAVPAIAQFPQLKTILSEMLLFGIRGFKTGRSLEAAFEAVTDDMGEEQQPAPPDPAMVETQAKMEIEKGKLQIEQQKMQATAEIEKARLALEQQRMQAETAFNQAKLQIEQQKAQGELSDRQAKAALDAQRMRAEQADREVRNQLAQLDYQLRAATTARPAEAPDTTEADQERMALDVRKVEADIAERHAKISLAERELALKIAAHNKALVDEDVSDTDGVEPSPAATMLKAVENLAAMIAESQQQTSAAHAEQIDLLVRTMMAPKRTVLIRDQTGRASAAETETIQ